MLDRKIVTMERFEPAGRDNWGRTVPPGTRPVTDIFANQIGRGAAQWLTHPEADEKITADPGQETHARPRFRGDLMNDFTTAAGDRRSIEPSQQRKDLHSSKG